MESKELFEQTSGYYTKLFVIFVGGILINVSIGVMAFGFESITILALIPITLIFVGVLMMRHYINNNNMETTVNLFIREDKYLKFVESALKYLGYKAEIFLISDSQNKGFIRLDNKYVVYVTNRLTLTRINDACETIKEEAKPLTIIMNDGYVTSEARVVAEQDGIIIHSKEEMYMTLDKAIKDRGWKPNQEGLMNISNAPGCSNDILCCGWKPNQEGLMNISNDGEPIKEDFMNIFDKLEKAPHIKQLMLKYEFPTSDLYPGNKYPKSRALNYIVNNASVHRPSIVTDTMTLVVTFKIKHRDEWLLAVQQNGTDLESNLDVYMLQDHMQFYEDLARIVLKNHGCSGNMKNESDCVKCADCDRILVVMEM